MIKGKIVFDARMINNSGIGRYIEKILANTIDHFEEIILLGNEKEIKGKLNRNDIRIIKFTSPFYSIYEQIKYPITIPKCDLFWSPHFNIPLLPIKAKKRLVTLHDVFHLAFFDMLTIPQKIYAKTVIKAALDKSDEVITVSNFSKQEILKYTNNKYDNKIHVIHNGIDPIEERNEKPNDNKKYFLAVGNIKPHKNFKRTLEAYEIFLERNLNCVDIPDFFIIGKIEGLITGDNIIFDLVNESDILRKHVHFKGFVSDEELKKYYKNALALIFPSYYEGFGFPPLESMQFGTPTIVSNAACMPEICGEAAIYFDPYNPADIAEKMELALDKQLMSELIIKSENQLAKFSWNDSSKLTVNLIKKMLNL